MRKITTLFIVLLWLCSFGVRAESVWDKTAATLEKPVDIVVYRSPTCGCCGKWVKHIKDHNFNVQDNVIEDMDSIKAKYGVPKDLGSCHTAIVNGYVIEGHVPAGDIINLLKNKPAVAGIAVPGMVTGSPGMEMGDRIDPFDVVSFDKAGKTQVFNSYGKR